MTVMDYITLMVQVTIKILCSPCLIPIAFGVGTLIYMHYTETH